MAKLIWAMIVSGVVLIAYPFFVRQPKYDESFSEAAIDALEYPVAVRVLTLIPTPSSAKLQEYWPGVAVQREFSTPKGWSIALAPVLKHATKPPTDAKAKGTPEYVIRFEGRAETVDLVWDKDSETIWFQERGKLRPFFAKTVPSKNEWLGILRPITATQRN